jgi:geranylgeranyl diphosphate synthase type II
MARQKSVVDAYLDQFLPRPTVRPEIIHEAMRYSVFAGGKRLRPILVLAVGEALDGDFEILIPLACAVELIHTYSLVHDDLPAMDNDDYRRGQLTAHRKYGEGLAILAGDGLLTLGFQLLAEVPARPGNAESKLEVIRRVARAIGTANGMVGGQAADLLTQGKLFSEEDLDYIHSSKTGALIQASVACAAVICGASPEALRAFSDFGVRLGLAFQIVDDILDVEGSSERLGKTSGKDAAVSKATYPALYGVAKSRETADRLVNEAVERIGFLGPKGEALKELARFVTIRRF